VGGRCRRLVLSLSLSLSLSLARARAQTPLLPLYFSMTSLNRGGGRRGVDFLFHIDIPRGSTVSARSSSLPPPRSPPPAFSPAPAPPPAVAATAAAAAAAAVPAPIFQEVGEQLGACCRRPSGDAAAAAAAAFAPFAPGPPGLWPLWPLPLPLPAIHGCSSSPAADGLSEGSNAQAESTKARTGLSGSLETSGRSPERTRASVSAAAAAAAAAVAAVATAAAAAAASAAAAEA